MATLLKIPPRRHAISTPAARTAQAPARLPEWMRRLDVRCHGKAHAPMPARMGFIGWGRTLTGDPVARYCCPLCGCTESWGMGHQCHKPKLFHRSFKRR